ncbi:MAG: fibronectin type III domain-containing protein [Deltaproteobacteria bacterium]|nr:fibronectin type III domain-containing protein [Deltaproteobacteria bacterium]
MDIDDFVLSTTYVGPGETEPDTQPPGRSNGSPSGTLAAGTTSTAVSLSTDEDAACKYATTAGVSYGSMSGSFSATGAMSHSFTASGLVGGNSYSFYVRCQDSSGNANADDFPISFTVDPAGATDAGTGLDATISSDASDLPGSIANLAVRGTTTSSVTLSFTEVSDGAGQPASYEVRYSQPPLSWGSATQVQGTCSAPLAGQSIGATRTCTVEGLSEATSYEFQLVAFRGTFQVNAVFGPLSNVAAGITDSSGAQDAGAADANGAGRDASTCAAGASCSSADGCRHGTTNCATGEAVCENLTNAPNGTSCGAQGTCQEGACSTCPAGESCASIDGCRVGVIDCSQTPAVCGSLTNRPDGFACSGGVCNAGACKPLASADAGNMCGLGTHLDPSSGTCIADTVGADAGPLPSLEAGCSCSAGASAAAPLTLLAGFLAITIRRKRLRR